MPDFFTPLSDREIEQLEDFLLNRIADDVNTMDMDEGIFDISSLDGFFTAIVSGPVLVAPSQWIAAIWGDFEPQWETEKDFEVIFSLLMRHMNGITGHLMSEPESFEPLFLERVVDGVTHTIVDEWCFGYLKGVELCQDQWNTHDAEMTPLLDPIMMFATELGWDRLDTMSETEVDTTRRAITSNVKKIHAFWLQRREQVPSRNPHRQTEPHVGRNDPCPCGSGKKYKKCCLH